MIHDELSKAFEGKEGFLLFTLWKAVLWLEKRYQEKAMPGLPFLIAQHYKMMGDHPEVREDRHLGELLREHALHWARLGEGGKPGKNRVRPLRIQRDR